MKPARDGMKRHSGAVDVLIVGAGAGGSTLAKELAEGGMSVVVLEAGPWLDTVEDFVNDELSMLGLVDWDELRISNGSDPLALGRINTGRGVGGSTTHFTAVKLRFHSEDFRLRSAEGVASDWPIDLDDLAPFYRQAEDFVGVSGPRSYPWGGRADGYDQGELSMSASDEKIAAGFEKLGMRWCMAPHAVLTAPMDGRSSCMNYGFCSNGCKSDAKGSALVTWIPAAVRAGAEIRDNAFVTRIDVDDHGFARGATYLHEGREHEQRARIVIVACYSIETPRLLLNSRCGLFPDGLCNSSGQVGRNLMVHPAAEVFGRFDEPLDSFLTPPVGILSEDPYGTQPGRDFVRGYVVNRYAHLPIDFITTLVRNNPDLWGERLFEVMDEYTHWGVLATMNEMLPRGTNAVTLDEEKDCNGVPVARVTMSYDDNDRRMLDASERHCEAIMQAAGATRTLHARSAVHVLGTCRMGSDPKTSVVDPWCRAHDVPNLYICDGSVFVTASAVNPSLTIEALALRTARQILRGRTGES